MSEGLRVWRIVVIYAELAILTSAVSTNEVTSRMLPITCHRKILPLREVVGGGCDYRTAGTR
jgi:hypothetical protein